MREHIQLTIRELVGRVARLQDIIKELQALGCEASGSVTLTVDPQVVARQDLAQDPLVQKPLKTYRRLQARKVRLTPARTTKAQTVGLGNRILEIVPSFGGEPFGQEDLRKVLGDRSVSEKQIGWTLKYYAKKGRLQVHTPGRPAHPAKYVMAAADGKNGEDGARGDARPPAGAPKNKPEIEGQLEKALKARDAANARGLEKIAAVHQREVDRLQGLLAKA